MSEARKAALKDLIGQCKKRMGAKEDNAIAVVASKDPAAQGHEEESAETGEDETKEQEGGIEGLMEFLKSGPLKGPSVKGIGLPAGPAKIIKGEKDTGKTLFTKGKKG